MPRGDGTGPMGMGPQTGRRAGFCAGYEVAGFQNPGGGRGAGGGRGRGGRGRRNRFHATGLAGWQRAEFAPDSNLSPDAQPARMSNEQQLTALREQAEAMENGLRELRSRIDELGQVAE